ncbi:hypothetical protein [[Eubacterium] cellulosolvens]
MTLAQDIFLVSEVQFVELEKLIQHEEYDPIYLEELTDEIVLDKILKFTIVVDKDTNIILDGVHRFNVLKRLGCKKVPIVYVDYNSPLIEVDTWKKGLHLTKKDVVKAGLSGKKFLPKTSKHMIRNGDNTAHILTIEEEVNVPIDSLRTG